MGFKIEKVTKKSKDEETDKPEKDEGSASSSGKSSGFFGGVKKKAAEEAEESSAKKNKGQFLKYGMSAQQEMAKAEAAAKARQEKRGKEYRYRMKDGEDAIITFIDGEIDEETGILSIPYLNEHRIKMDGNWTDVVCIESSGHCPLCDAGDSKSFIGLMTIIDHRPRDYTDKDGKEHHVEATKRVYPAKSETLKTLAKIASKHDNGLVGLTFEVSRTGEYKANVGDLFECIGEHSLKEIADEFGKEFAEPVDYDSHILVFTPKEMKDLGIGKSVSSIGSKSGKGKSADDIDDNKSPWKDKDKDDDSEDG